MQAMPGLYPADDPPTPPRAGQFGGTGAQRTLGTPAMTITATNTGPQNGELVLAGLAPRQDES